MVTTTLLHDPTLYAQHADPRVIPTTCRRSQATDLLRRTSDTPDGNFATTLLAMAGHDLRQPLQIITSAHDVLLTILNNQKGRKELAFAAQATARLARMLDQLVEALQLHPNPSDNKLSGPVALRTLFKPLAAEFDRTARLKGVGLNISTARGAILSHPVLLTGILRNLLRNAIDYTPAGGSVSIACQRRGPDLSIEVRDTGVGIRTSALSMIFDAFERTDESRIDGLGLGLFIVKRAADLIGHRIEVRSVEGQGSCFTVVGRAAPIHRARKRAVTQEVSP